MPPHFHFFHPYPLSLFLFVIPSCLCPTLASENLWLLPILPHLTSHLMLAADCCIIFPHFLLPLFSLLVYWHVFCLSGLRLIHLLLYTHKVTIIGKHGICSLNVGPGRWVSYPVFFDSKQIFKLLSGSIETWMSIKCRRGS
jgi:hypothetical protein